MTKDELREWETKQLFGNEKDKMPKSTFRFIRGCLHPDREAEPERKKKARDLFAKYFQGQKLIGK